MTDEQLKQIIAAIKAFQKQCEDNDCATNVGFIHTEVEQIKADIREIRKLLELRK